MQIAKTLRRHVCRASAVRRAWQGAKAQRCRGPRRGCRRQFACEARAALWPQCARCLGPEALACALGSMIHSLQPMSATTASQISARPTLGTSPWPPHVAARRALGGAESLGFAPDSGLERALARCFCAMGHVASRPFTVPVGREHGGFFAQEQVSRNHGQTPHRTPGAGGGRRHEDHVDQTRPCLAGGSTPRAM